MWPLSRQQVDGVIWRLLYSPEAFKKTLASWSNGDAFYEDKAGKVMKSSYSSYVGQLLVLC